MPPQRQLGEDDTFAATPNPSPESTAPGLAEGQPFAGRFRIERRVGRGGMGVVYAAYDEAVGERVAIKVLTNTVGVAVERFRREVRLARRVTHRNAARTFDLGEHEGRHFITMELVEGESLHERLAREGRLRVEPAVDIAVQICQGLQAAHAVEVVHRDLKPGNVLIEPSGRAVVTDFGVARALADDARITMNESTMLGTPAYVAPEQLQGASVDARADLYAVGVILYEMLSGRRPFEGDNALAIALARLHAPPVDPRQYAPMPAELALLVMRCLSRAPEHRPADAAALAQALRSTGTVSSTPSQPTPSPATPTPSSYVTTSPGQRALAVMPFKYRGPPDDAYLAESLTEELVDLLSMTRGLRVLGTGATTRFGDQRDAQLVGRELGVEALVDGTVQRARDRVRISARLVEADTGVQRWSERFDGPLEDLFDLQDRLAKRVAEALRLVLVLLASRARAPAEAVELYLRGRSRARESDLVGRALEGAAELFERCLALAPDFGPALAARADVCVRRWFLASSRPSQDWEAESRAAVERALQGAADLAETHLAAARLAVSSGDFEGAAAALNTALHIAPTYAAAHEYLGFLQCEAGRSREGVRHIELAVQLDPSLGVALLSILRHHALQGDHESGVELLARIRRDPQIPRFAIAVTELRLAAWRGDRETIERIRLPTDNSQSPSMLLPMMMRDFLLGDTPPAQMAASLDPVVARLTNPRFRTTARQIAAELLASAGAPELAMQQLHAANETGVLVDADWMDRCPSLESLRSREEFEQIRDEVRMRADAIWRARP